MNKEATINSQNSIDAGTELPSQIKSIIPEKVKEISWIGNGLKVHALMGVMEVLEKEKANDAIQYKNIQINGSSSGAMIALFLSMGMGISSIDEVLSSLKPDIVFDPPTFPRKVPAINGFHNESRNDFLYNEGLTSLSDVLRKTINASLPEYFKQNLPDLMGINATINLLDELQNQFSDRSVKNNVNNMNEVLNKYWLLLYRNLYNDYGFFSGSSLRNFIDKLLTEQSKTDYINITFRQHAQFFRTKLNIQIFNASLGRFINCNATTTPDLPVSDALRITLGAPVLYKPYKVNKKDIQQLQYGLPAGWYIQKTGLPQPLKSNEFRVVLGCEKNDEPESLFEYMSLVNGQRCNDNSSYDEMCTNSEEKKRNIVIENLHSGITDFYETENISKRLRYEAKKSLYLQLHD